MAQNVKKLTRWHKQKKHLTHNYINSMRPFINKSDKIKPCDTADFRKFAGVEKVVHYFCELTAEIYIL